MRARDVLVLSVLCAQAAWVGAQEEQEQAIEVKAGTSVELDGEAMMEAIRARQKNRQNTENEPASPDAHVETTVRETTVIRETTTDDDAKVDESSTVETSQTSHESDSTGPASASETVECARVQTTHTMARGPVSMTQTLHVHKARTPSRRKQDGGMESIQVP